MCQWERVTHYVCKSLRISQERLKAALSLIFLLSSMLSDPLNLSLNLLKGVLVCWSWYFSLCQHH